MMAAAHACSWPGGLAAVVSIVAAALLCCGLPLCDMLGYESALVLGLVCACVAPALGLSAAARSSNAVAAMQKTAGPLGGALLAAALIVGAHGRLVGACNDAVGLGFWCLLPLCSAAFGGMLGIWVGQWSACRSHFGLRWALAAVLPLVALSQSLLRLYTEPPIRAYSHLFGYFAGSLFDEDVAIDAALCAFRVSTLWQIVKIAGGLAFIARTQRRWLVPVVHGILAVSLLSGALDARVGGAWGYAIDRRLVLERALPVSLARPGVVVHLAADVPPEVATAIADDHAFRAFQITAQVPQQEAGPIHSYVFATANDKARWLGGRDTLVSKPWLRELYLHGYDVPHPMLAHEMVHAALSPWAPGPLHLPTRFGGWPNIPMVEGMAMALAPDTTPLGLSATARNMQALGLGAPLSALLHTNPWVATRAFWSESPERVYTQTGAFFSYLLQRFGIAPLLDAYRDGDVARALGDSLPHLEDAFVASLGAEPPAPTTQARVAGEMRRESVFVRRCPHETAALFRQSIGMAPGPRVSLMRALMTAAGGGPDAQLWLVDALRQAARQRGETADDAEALQIQAALLAAPHQDPVLRAKVLEAASQQAARTGHDDEARAWLEEGLALPVADPFKRSFAVRHMALALDAETRPTVLGWLSGDRAPARQVQTFAALSERAERLERGLGRYALGRVLWGERSFAAAYDVLAASAPLTELPLERERLRMMALCAWQSHRVPQARAALEALAPITPLPGERNWQRDLATRLDYEQRLAPMR